MLKRRDLLKSIGAIIGVGVLGEATQAEAAPVETPPVVQAPKVENLYTMGSVSLSGTIDFYALRGSGDPFVVHRSFFDNVDGGA